MKCLSISLGRLTLLLCFILIYNTLNSQSADFKIQHVVDDISNTGGSNTSFTAVSDLTNAFALPNNNRKVSGGIDSDATNRNANDLSGARVLTATNTLTYYRESGSVVSNTRFNTSIWEYTGPSGGDNEMIVRGRYTITLNGSTNSTTQALSGITNANKCIPFITGILTNTSSQGADSGTAIAYLENASTLRVQKGTNANNVTVYITLVEFTGSNWTVLHGDSGESPDDSGSITLRDGADGTGTATDVSNWSNAIIFTQHRGDNTQDGTNDAIADNWPLTDPGSNNQTVDWLFHGDHDSNGTNRHFVHILSNTNLNVTRFQNTSSTNGETTIDISSVGLTNTSEALIIGTSTSSGTGTAYARGWRNYYFNSTTEVAHWSARSGNTMSHEIQIVDFSNVSSVCAQETIVHFADFESNWDSWTDGGANVNRVNNATRSYSNNYSIELSSNDTSGNSSSMLSPSFNLSQYDKVDFVFFFTSHNSDNGDDFFVEYSSDNGTNWTIINDFDCGDVSSKTGDYESTDTIIFYGKTVTVQSTDFTFPNSASSRFRVRSDADETNDLLYIDNISIIGTRYCTPNTVGPGGITTNLDLWLKADQLDGSTEGTDGNNVSEWRDNGKGNHAKTVVTGLEPVYRDNTSNNFNFNPVIEFENNNSSSYGDMTYIVNDGSRDELKGTGGFNSDDIFMVVMPDPTITTSIVPLDTFCSSDPTSTNTATEDVTGFGYGNYSVRFSNERFGYCIGTSASYGRATTDTNVDFNQIHIINTRHNSGDTGVNLYLNNNQFGNLDANTGSWAHNSNTRYWLGRSQYWNGSFDGRIAEVITYSATNSDTDLTQARNRIQSYLAIKYGITLGTNGTSQDYVDSNGTVIWDQSVNTGYNYDIAGIGRDDASELNQKQSRSVNDDTDGTGRTQGILTIGLTDIYETNTDNKASNPTNFNDGDFLIWGNNGADLEAAPNVITVNMSSSIAPALSTQVTFNGMQRVWKVVENGSNIPTVKIRLQEDAVRNITPPGNYYMFISDTDVFNPTADYRLMESDGSGNLETEYDFDGTKYITFGYAPEVEVERSIYFDGINDYIDVENRLSINTTDFTISAWIKRDAVDSGTKSIISKRDIAFTQGIDFRILDNNSIEIIWKNGSDQSLISNTRLPDDKWHHVSAIYDGTNVFLYIDGILDNSDTRSNPISTNDSFIIGAAGKDNPVQFFNGHIDEVRIWDTALTVDQLRFIMNQEIEENSGQVTGSILPSTIKKNDINAIAWSELAAYYPMSIFSYTNTLDLSGNGKQGALRNLDTVDRQSAPLPYESNQNGNWDTDTTWNNGSVQYIPGSTSIVDTNVSVDWNIIRTTHNITMDNSSLPSANGDNRTILGLYVDANELTVDGDNSTDTGNGLTVSHYLSLEGKIDLEGESQLIQTHDSDLLVVSNGVLEKDQQGTADTFTYNYWSAPVGEVDLSENNYRYTVEDIFYDASNPVNFTSSGYNGSATSPVTISDYWIWKYNNHPAGDYSSWQHVRRTGNINAGEGFTMKGPGTGSISTEQNYEFLGKPNNGNVTLNITSGNNYLVGNPYASAIDADKFIEDNGPILDYVDPTGGSNPETNTLLSGTLYFWEHWGGGSHILQEYQGGYASYNYSGAVAAASLGTNDPDVGTGGTPTKLPGRYIPVGQGFFVTADNTGSITFNNNQRVFVKEGSAASVFVKNNEFDETTESAEIDERMKFRFGFYSISTNRRQLLLTIDDDATTGVDWAYDAKVNENQTDDMTWRINNENYVIQGSNELESSTIYPLCVKTSMDGIGSISIDELENVPDDIQIYLHDNSLNLYHDLRVSNYDIFLNTGLYENRFEITFDVPSTLGINDELSESLDILYSSDKENLVLINPHNKAIKSLDVYNMLGQPIFSTTDISQYSSHSEYKLPTISSGTYIVKLNTNDDATISKKIIVN